MEFRSSQLLLETPSLLAVAKPEGLASAPRVPGSDTPDNAAILLARDFPELLTLPDLGLVHRLDTDTSGVLVFARTAQEHTRLREAWATGAVQKLYWARVRAREGLRLPHAIDLPIGHSAKTGKRMLVVDTESKTRGIRGKPLEARTVILEARPAPTAGLMDVLLELHQGVRHQLRVHLASAAMPILGDRLYSPDPAPRMFLHAWRVVLDGVVIEAPVPFDAPAELANPSS